QSGWCVQLRRAARRDENRRGRADHGAARNHLYSITPRRCRTPDRRRSDQMARFQCAHCGAFFPTTALLWRCATCDGHLNVEGTASVRRSDIDRSRSSLWRYQKALVHEGPVGVFLGEGWTPLIETQWVDRPILWKCEFVSISGSFK